MCFPTLILLIQYRRLHLAILAGHLLTLYGPGNRQSGRSVHLDQVNNQTATNQMSAVHINEQKVGKKQLVHALQQARFPDKMGRPTPPILLPPGI